MQTRSLRERLRMRRQRLKDTLEESQDLDQDNAANNFSGQDSAGKTSEEEDAIESQKMMRNINRRRRKNKEKLTDEVQKAEDEEDGLQSARRRTRERIRNATQQRLAEKSADEEEEQSEKEDDEAKAETDQETPVGTLDGTDQSRIAGRVRSRMGSARRTSVALPKSMNFLIQRRLAAVKDKAKSEARDELDQEEEPVGRLIGRRGLNRSTRFDDPSLMSREAVEAEATLEKSLSLLAKRKDGSKVKKSRMPTQEEAFDFFSRNWEPEPEIKQETETKEEKDADAEEKPDSSKDAVEEPEPGTSQQADEEDNVETDTKDAKKKKKKKKANVPEDEEPLISSEDLDILESYLYYDIARADYIPFRERSEEEQKTYFTPSVRRAAIEERIFDREAPRYLEEEGFYVGSKPAVPRTNLYRLENRLLNHKAQGWFGEDGEVLALPDPLKTVPSRPPIPEELQQRLSTFYAKAFYQDIDNRIIAGNFEGQGPYQLDVDINTLVFQHHHLFSREHVLASRLTQLYQKYQFRHQKKITLYLTDKLRALKSASLHMQENIAIMKDSEKEISTRDQERLLQEYQLEIRVTRRKRDRELEADRTLLKSIISTWKSIKDIRRLQNYTNTPVKLKLRREESNREADQAEWDVDVKDEVEEMLLDAREKFEEEMALYKDRLSGWKQQRLAKKEAQKRQKRRERRQGRSVQSVDSAAHDDIEEELKDQKILSQLDLDKPEKPTAPVEKNIRQTVQAKLEQFRRKPGEVKLHPELTNGASISQNTTCAKAEQLRRNEVNKAKVFVKVIFNGKEVSQTPSKLLGQDFVVRFAQIISIQILQWPEKIELEVYEAAGLTGGTLMARLYIPTPDPSITSDTVQLDDMSFSTDYRVAHNHEGVGSGVEISISGDNRDSVFENTTGLLSASACWATDEQGNVLIPPIASHSNTYYSAMRGFDAVAAIGAAAMADMEKLSIWIAKSRLDPNDPANVDLMYLLRPAGDSDVMGSALRMPDYFRLEQLQEEFNFATDEEIDKSQRFRMLELRSQETEEFKNYRMVPAFDREVPKDTFAEYDRGLREREQIRNMKDRSSHRAAVAQFMQNVRDEVMQRFHALAHQKVLEDVVFEEQVPNIGTLIPNLMKLAEPRRPLRPKRRERKKMMPQNLQQSDVKLLVNIVRAIDVPVRTESAHPVLPSQSTLQPDQSLRRSMRLKELTSQVQVRPFVEVSFQRNNETTSVAEGPNPSWNEELALPFKAPNNDYSGTNLQRVKDFIFINLFDEIIIDLMQDDNEGRNIQRRIERKWLGSMKIPFSTVYFNSRIDGTFRINKPRVLLGYQNDSNQMPGDRDLDTGFQVVGEAGSTYISLFITVEPALMPLEPVREKFETNEDTKLLLDCEKWVTGLQSKFPKRDVKTTVTDINGKAVFITRYLNKLRPPELLINDQPNELIAAERVARFVSLIPFVSDSVVFPGVCEIWSTCDQFLLMLQGDEEEHAVLLTNYFLYMGKTAYLLIGTAIPEGPTAYVITKEVKDYWIWNASTGEHYSYRDNYCPVTNVVCLVGPDNIWANIQPFDQPARISFDLHNPRNWSTFFHKGYSYPGLSTVQPEIFNYAEPDKDYALDLQDKLERLLKEKIMAWRPKHITRWNRNCIQAFRRILPKLEENLGKSVPVEQMAELQTLLGNNKLSGFPINVQYTDMEPIVETVFATGVHNHETNEVEFALAVYVHPYPAYVLSVWIYVASLTRVR